MYVCRSILSLLTYTQTDTLKTVPAFTLSAHNKTENMINQRKVWVVLRALCSVASMPACKRMTTTCFLPFIAAKCSAVLPNMSLQLMFDTNCDFSCTMTTCTHHWIKIQRSKITITSTTTTIWQLIRCHTMARVNARSLYNVHYSHFARQLLHYMKIKTIMVIRWYINLLTSRLLNTVSCHTVYRMFKKKVGPP